MDAETATVIATAQGEHRAPSQLVWMASSFFISLWPADRAGHPCRQRSERRSVVLKTFASSSRSPPTGHGIDLVSSRLKRATGAQLERVRYTYDELIRICA